MFVANKMLAINKIGDIEDIMNQLKNIKNYQKLENCLSFKNCLSLENWQSQEKNCQKVGIYLILILRIMN